MKYYRNYLPNYLGGPNIDSHSTILEEEDAGVYDGLSLLELWCNLPRPLMIQREAVSLESIHMIVRVDIPQIIKKITITGEYNYTMEYDEVDITTTAEVDFYIQGSTEYLKNPDITVTVETYDEITYTKAYPENDTTTGDLHDHDEFLDRIGNLLGIPRRIYKSYPFVDADKSMPAYNGKQITTIDGDKIVQSCTEDDYYYQERLQYYLANFNKMALPILLLRTIYGYEHVTEANTAMIESGGVWQHIKDSSAYIAADAQAGTYLFLVNRDNPVNIQTLSDDEKVAFVDKYIPVTRNAIILPQLLTSITLLGNIIDGVFPKGYDHLFYARLVDEYNVAVPNRDVIFTVDGQPADISTPTNIQGRASATFRNMNMGYHTVKVENPTGHGYEGSTDKHMYKSYLDERQIYDIPGQVIPLGVYDELPAVPCDDCPYMLLYSISTNHPCRIKIDLVNNNGTLSNIAVSEDIYGIHIVAVYPDTMQVFVDGVEVEVTVDDTVIFNPHDCQYKVLLECDGITHVYRSWITDYHIYNQGNVELDEFTLLYIVDVPENDDTYTCTLGHLTDGFEVDIFDFEEMIGDCTGLHFLEYKFLNYQCYLYIDNNLVSQFDFETNTQIDDPRGEAISHSHQLVTYLQSPTLATDYIESYFLPITDYMSIPEHRGLLRTVIGASAVESNSDTEITQVYTCNYYQGTAFRLRLALLSAIPETYEGNTYYNRKLFTGTVQIHTTLDNHPTPIETDTNVQIPERKTTPFTGDTRAAGSVTFDITYPRAWMRESDTTTLQVTILPTPCQLRYEDNSPIPYYTSPTQNIDYTAFLETITVPGPNGQQQPITGEDIQVYYDNTLISDDYTTGEYGTVPIDDIPVGLKPGNHTLRLEYPGNNLHLLEYDENDTRIEYAAAQSVSTTVEVMQNQAQLYVEVDDVALLNSDIPCRVTVTDMYDDPVTQTHVYVRDTANGINLSDVPDENGVCEFTIPAMNTTGVYNLKIRCTANSYCGYAAENRSIRILENIVRTKLQFSSDIGLLLRSQVQEGLTIPFNLQIVDENDDPITIPSVSGMGLARAIALNQYISRTDITTIKSFSNDGSPIHESVPIYLNDYVRENNLRFRARFIGHQAYQPSTAELTIPVTNDSALHTRLSIQINPASVPVNWQSDTPVQIQVTLIDVNDFPVKNADIQLTLPDNTTPTITTNNQGVATTTVTFEDVPTDFYYIHAEYDGQEWDGSNAYQPAEIWHEFTISDPFRYATQLSMTHSFSGDTINLSDLTTVTIPVSVTLGIDDGGSNSVLSGKTIHFKYYDGTNIIQLTTATTNSNGVATANLTGLTSTDASSIQLLAYYNGDERYGAASQSLTFNIYDDSQTPVYVDPLNDTDFFDINSWGTYPSGASGSSQTGTLAAATTSDLTINDVNKTITDNNQKYFVYKYTLQDFFNYYGDEFSLIAYKTGGDGRYQLGFVNTTTGGYKLGYIDGSAVNNEASSSTSLGEVKYQMYNEITFERNGTDITIYWKYNATTFKSKTMPLGTVDPTKYYLYWRSTVRSGFTLTNDTSKIQNHSRP